MVPLSRKPKPSACAGWIQPGALEKNPFTFFFDIPMRLFKSHILPLPCFLTTAFVVLAIAVMAPAATPDKFDALAKRLVSDGIAPQRVAALYADGRVAFDFEGVSRFFMHREATLNYRQFLSEPQLQKARTYMAAHARHLKAAEAETGVAAEVITAVLLVETRLGQYLGNRKILNTLSTMAALDTPGTREAFWKQMAADARISRPAFEKKSAAKAAWAYDELKAFIIYTGQEGMPAHDLVGSYAGALGIAQFMPSNVLLFARDGDGDGRIDLYTHPDAIASVAGYLAHYGWRQGIDRQKAQKVIWHYNRSRYYVDTVLDIADRLKEK